MYCGPCLFLFTLSYVFVVVACVYVCVFVFECVLVCVFDVEEDEKGR